MEWEDKTGSPNINQKRRFHLLLGCTMRLRKKKIFDNGLYVGNEAGRNFR